MLTGRIVMINSFIIVRYAIFVITILLSLFSLLLSLYFVSILITEKRLFIGEIIFPLIVSYGAYLGAKFIWKSLREGD